MQNSARLKLCSALVMLSSFLFAGCGGGGGGGEVPPTVTQADFATEAVAIWNGFDYALQNPDGETDSDGDGEVDANGGVVVIETLRSLGYDLPATTLHGLAENFYTAHGYDLQANDVPESSRTSFKYTLPTTITQDDLINARWDLLEVGDIIFVDYDKDFTYDEIGIYVGPFTGSLFTTENAVMSDLDYYDKILVLDLDYTDEWINQDIRYGYSTVRRLNLDGF